MLIFIDESGNFRLHDPALNNFGERHVTLAATIFEKNEHYADFKKKIKALKVTYAKYIGDQEIKSRTVRRSNPKNIHTEDAQIYDFHKYSEGQEKYENFCKELKGIVAGSTFQIISVSTDKVVSQSLYPHKDLLVTMLTDMWERIFICHVLSKTKKSRIFFDPQLNLHDDVLIESYKSFCRTGSWFIPRQELDKINLYKNIFPVDSEASHGIQLADYCAYPIKRQIESHNYSFFKEIIKAKLHPDVRDHRQGKRVMMGLKETLVR